uniref:Uncharacterized protein n=1 Tax=Bos indicus x Bos taurus TaxID=30522 RepID=A0A4W2GQS5_BOBOX
MPSSHLILYHPLLLLPPIPPSLIAESLRRRRLLRFLTHPRTPSCPREFPRIGGQRLLCSGLPVGSPEQKRGDDGGYVAGCPGTGAGRPAGAAGLAPPRVGENARWPPTGRHYFLLLSPDPLETSLEFPIQLHWSGGVYKRGPKPRRALCRASASPGEQLYFQPP